MRGAQRIESWAPGVLAAGGRPFYEAGRFPVPMNLVGIYREGAGSANAGATATVRQASGGTGKTAVFEGLLTTSQVFNPGQAGGRHLLNVPLAPGESVLFQLAATGAVAAETWIFVFETPEITRRTMEAFLPQPKQGA